MNFKIGTRGCVNADAYYALATVGQRLIFVQRMWPSTARTARRDGMNVDSCGRSNSLVKLEFAAHKKEEQLKNNSYFFMAAPRK